MALEIDTPRQADGRRRRAWVLAGSVTALVVVVGIGVAVWAHGSGSTPAFGPISLRAVESSTQQPCSLPPLTTGGAGSACDASGTHTYALGESLGDLPVTHAAIAAAGDGSRLSVELDAAGRATLADVTGSHAGERVAWVVDGVVLTAPAFAGGSMDVPELLLAAGSAEEAATWLELLAEPSQG